MLSGIDGVRLSGAFQRSPLAGTYFRTEMEWAPLTRAREYAQFALFERPSDAPVLLSVTQRHRLLADLVCGLYSHVGGLSCALVRTYGPDFNVQLPSRLLEPDVLLVHDPLEVLPLLLEAGHSNIAVIQHDLRADGMDRGGNVLSVSLLKPEPELAQVQRFAEWVNVNPLLGALSEARLEPLGQVRLT
jgi:hypothetical protein